MLNPIAVGTFTIERTGSGVLVMFAQEPVDVADESSFGDSFNFLRRGDDEAWEHLRVGIDPTYPHRRRLFYEALQFVTRTWRHIESRYLILLEDRQDFDVLERTVHTLKREMAGRVVVQMGKRFLASKQPK